MFTQYLKGSTHAVVPRAALVFAVPRDDAMGGGRPRAREPCRQTQSPLEMHALTDHPAFVRFAASFLFDLQQRFASEWSGADDDVGR